MGMIRAIRPWVISMASGLVVCFGVAAPVMAGNGNPVFSVTGNSTYNGVLPIQNTASVFVQGGVLTVVYTVNPGDGPAQIATSLQAALNAGTNPGIPGGSTLPTFFNFAAPVAINGGFAIQGTTLTPTRSFGAARTTGKGLSVPRAAAGQPRNFLRIGVAVDPMIGTADFHIEGDPVGDGSVIFGVGGIEASVDTSGPSGTLNDDQILQTLESELFADGLTHFALDLVGDQVSEFGVSTGDPIATNGADIGAFVDNTDSGLATYADVLVPEPTSLGLIGAGALAALLRRRR